MTLTWLLLLFAGLMEIVWAIGMKKAEGFTKLWPSLWTIVAMLISFGALAIAVTRLPIGTAYAVWTGIGAVGTATYGILFMNESASPGRLFAIALIIVGIVMLKVLPNGSG
jgi:quaternary ammonium compound-resistance protein SugE